MFTVRDFLANHRPFPPRPGSMAGVMGPLRGHVIERVDWFLAARTLFILFESLHCAPESVRAHHFLYLFLVFYLQKCL